MDELTERIDLYLRKQLSLEEEKLFKEEIDKNEDLAKKVDLQKKTTDLLEANAWLATKDNVAQLNQKKSLKSGRTMRFQWAAIFIGVIVLLGIFMNYRYSDKSLYANYRALYPDRISVMGEEQDEIAQAMIYYNEGKYKVAAEAFKNIGESDSKTDLIVLYEAISLRESGQIIESIQLIEGYTQQDMVLKEVFAWNLILAYLVMEESEKAYRLLIEYEQEGYAYQKSAAKSLKEDLESIWRIF